MLSNFLAKLAGWWSSQSTLDMIWLGVGLAGQLMFSMRWIVQWLASEKAKRSIVPEVFWYFSFFGGLMVMAYGFYKVEPVLILGQFGVFIYGRNIYFLWKRGHELEQDTASAKRRSNVAAE